MKPVMNVWSMSWWFWLVTLALLLAGLGGWQAGFPGAGGLSAVQVVFFMVRERSAVSFPVQVRIAYLGLVVVALFDPWRVLFVLLALGTVMVTFFDRCFIALVLRKMPWNAEPAPPSSDTPNP